MSRTTRTMTTAAGAALALLLLSGCGGGGSDSSSASADSVGRAAGSAPAEPGAKRDLTGDEGTGSTASGSGGSRSDAAAPLVTDQRVVRVADMSVRAKDVTAAAVRVRAAVEAAKGFVADEKTTNTLPDPSQPELDRRAGYSQSVLTLRVPNESLDRVMSQVAATGTLLSRTQSSDDVTQTYVDVRSRVASQTASVERVRALLSQATTIGQIVQVEGELSRRESDLESIKAQLSSLEDRTQLSTLTVTLLPPAVADGARTPRQDGFLSGLRGGWDALTASLTVLLTVVGALLPFAVAAALVGVPAAVLWRRTRRPRSTGTPPAQPQPAP